MAVEVFSGNTADPDSQRPGGERFRVEKSATAAFTSARQGGSDSSRRLDIGAQERRYPEACEEGEGRAGGAGSGEAR